MTKEHQANLHSSQMTHSPLHFHTTYSHNDNSDQKSERDQDEHPDSLQWRMKETQQLPVGSGNVPDDE